MEDVWIHTVSDAPPLWLTDASVRKGVRGMLKIDQCEEEQKRLGMEADGMCAWFGHELATVTIVLYSPDSKQHPSYLILTDTYLYLKDTRIRCQLQQQRDDLLRLQHLWATPLISSILYASHVNAADALANENPHHLRGYQ